MANVVIKYRYELVQSLGQTPLFSTWQAHDRLLNQDVVLKLLQPLRAANVTATDAFIKEMNLLRRLVVNRVTRVLECGRDHRNVYVVREYVKGSSLAHRAALQPTMPWRETLNWGLLLAEVLEELHARGVPHGQLHPRNVFLTSEGRLLVTDAVQAVVVARTYRESGPQAADPRYLAPEQRAGQPPSVPSDLFSLGALLYELLAGPSATAALQPFPPQEPEPLSRFVPEAPPEIDQLLGKLLHREPAERYQSAQEVKEALRAARESRSQPAPARRPPRPRPPVREPEPPASPPAPSQAWRWLRSGLRVLAVFVGALFFTGLTLAAGAYGFYYWWIITAPPEVVVPDVKGQTFEAARATMAAAGLDLFLGAEQPSEEVPRDGVIYTSPPGGRRVKKGRRIQAVVSTGREKVTVPSVQHKSLERAKEVLQRAGLKPGTEEAVYSETVPAGRVIDQSPPGGERVEKGTVVHLRISQGSRTPRSPSEPEPEGASAAPEEIRMGVVKITVPAHPEMQQVKIVVRDEQGERVVYDQLHLAGDTIAEPVEGVGESVVEVYLNEKLVESRAL